MASIFVSRLLISLNEVFDKDVKIELFSGLGTQIFLSTARGEVEEPVTIMFASIGTGNTSEHMV